MPDPNGSLSDLQSAFADLNREIAGVSSGLRGALGELNRFTGAITSTVGKFVEAFAPVHLQRFALAAKDTAAAVGQILVPVLDRFRLVVRAIGDTIVSLSPAARNLVAALAAGGVAMVAMTGLTFAFATAVNSATFGLSAIVGAIAGVAVGTGMLSGTLGQFQAVLRQAAERVRPVLDAIGEAFRTVGAALSPLLGRLGEMAARLAGPLTEMIGRFAETVAGLAAAVLPVVVALAEVFQPLGLAFERLKVVAIQLAATALRPVLALIEALAPVVRLLITPLTAGLQMLGTIGALLADVLGPVLEVALTPLKLLGEFLGVIATEVSGAIGALQGAFSEVTTLIGDIAAELAAAFRELLDAVRPLLGAITGAMLAGLRAVTGAIREVASWISFLVAQLRDLLGLPGPQQTGPAKSSAGMGFVQTRTGTTDSYLQKLQENALALGKGPDPQKETSKNTSVLVLKMETLITAVENLPPRIAEIIVNRAKQASAGAASVAGGATWQAAREVAGRVFG
ncbi:MAG TPA: hypothetical protein VM597_36180 [Gemmataceae bacterium]|jgi:phage-related protein|nr:hypothetical protein [Gemmataceae bacterium]